MVAIDLRRKLALFSKQRHPLSSYPGWRDVVGIVMILSNISGAGAR